MLAFTPRRAIGALCARGFPALQKRWLNLHEYQSVQVMQSYHVHTPKGLPAFTGREAEAAASALQAEQGDIDFVVKAQVLAGGRGLGYFKENGFQGGVHQCQSPSKVKEIAKKMLGNTLVTKQTGEAGKPCNAIFVCERLYLRREKYFAILMDRSSGGPLMIGSAVGGTSIEDIAAKDPTAIVKMPIDITVGLSEAQAREFAEKLAFEGDRVDQAAQCIMGLYKMFIDKDCTLVEINPFAETHDGRVMVCDAKVNFDDNAEFRHEDIFEMRDTTQEDPREVQAARFDLNYVGLDGNIGCMVNGAGLAMATMDIIKLNGGSPANFLDVGGGASKTQVVEAFRILQNDPKVKAILVNIFGGIMRCDTIALGVIHASQEIGLSKPLVVRLEGTNQEQAKKLIDESGLKMLFSTDLSESASKAVKMAEIIELAESAELDVAFAL
ncbi:unnamed protein product [Vitrella brassicaformis CCMP3155]|uniref:Succinate--CoA ligase [ADP-forming] subunit beta, mitochondrial n=2 Tax=Vitrella brassicaformis TaxID=1169539 RepID=A0A0G4EP40_VITBC|nr:unnamed protein product [Vitrella brassicaformis CCMP3155]|eukprot:CEL98573.1 unnamed protein product [Vitrella brassicaformis CCMP3155]